MSSMLYDDTVMLSKTIGKWFLTKSCQKVEICSFWWKILTKNQVYVVFFSTFKHLKSAFSA